MKKRLFVFGLGYSARALARTLGDELERVLGTSRTDGGAGPIEVAPFQRGRPLGAPAQAALSRATHVLTSVPPDKEGDVVLATHGELLKNLPESTWIGYLSSTGVYGDHDGAWVDEESPLRATSEMAVRRLHAEEQWRKECPRAHIFRLGGIYGPGRNVLERLLSQKAQRIHAPGVLFSRIHVEDIASTLRRSMDQPNPGRIYNVVDDEPADSETVLLEGCRLLGLGPPPQVPLNSSGVSARLAAFYADRRRVRNDRLRNELRVSLRYPTYREGLRALMEQPPPTE